MRAQPAPIAIQFHRLARRFAGRRGVAVMRELRVVLNSFTYRGDRYECPLCGARLQSFLPLADASMTDAQCPACRSLARHRFLWLMLARGEFGPRPSEQLLHFAPEWALERHLAPRLGRGYVTADVVPGRAMRVLDLSALALPDACFDWVLCSHVLEHVPDDGRALAEIMRILRPGGRLILQVPVRDGSPTIETPPGADAEYRTRHFGLADHMRLYGADLESRLSASGFTMQVWDPVKTVSHTEFHRYSLDMTPSAEKLFTAQSRIFLCRKP